MNNPFEAIDTRLANIERILLGIKNPEKPTEPSDLIGIEEAQIECGTPGNPVSKAFIYANTSNGDMPHSKRNNRLVFSRRQLRVWVEARTKKSENPEQQASEILKKSAKKHLNK